ncbi:MULTISPECIES: VOC family protein [Sporosarcina]|uniref:VOC family protein n=1 Tax=Sporosarcina contaminans TaxID=633403 RepID=A0ABW3U109_9BACL
MAKSITTFLMFEGKAKQAMDFYQSLFPNSEIQQIDYAEDGTVRLATFILNGETFMCIDSSVHHAFTFTPSISMFVECDSIDELERLFHRLSEGGQVLMDLGEIPGSEKFGWVQDQFGVSWQLNVFNA